MKMLMFYAAYVAALFAMEAGYRSVRNPKHTPQHVIYCVGME